MSVAVRSEIEELVSLRPGVFLATDEERLILFSRLPWYRSQSFGAPTATKRSVLARLAGGACPATELQAVTTLTDDEPGALVHALRSGGWLVTTVRHAGRDLYSLQPVDGHGDPPECPVEELTLCRFAVLRREGGDVVVESPLGRARMLVHDAAVTATVAELAHGDAGGPAPRWPQPVRDAILRDLIHAGLAVSRSADDLPDRRLWSPPELWLHKRSRTGNGGYAGAGFGRTERATPFVEPPDPHRAHPTEPAIGLHRPDLEELERSDRPLTAVIEDRRSIRTHDDDAPITVRQLGELLYRCAGRRTRVTGGPPEWISRPYPAGGGLYELELYPVVHLVDGLAPGMYHYDPRAHELRLVRGPGRETERLLRGAAWSARVRTRPQVLLVAAARFGRLTSSYEELAYALMLKHVGVLYQTIYLVATSMGLAACALGAGDAMAFTDATGLEYTAESSVGEFILGSRTPQWTGEA